MLKRLKLTLILTISQTLVMTLSQHIRHQFLPSKNAQRKPLGRPELPWEAVMQPHIQQESALSCSPNPNNPNPNYDPKATHT